MAKKPAEFLQQYDILLFDMDGVITSEQRYWDTAALAVFQLLFPKEAAEDPAGLTHDVAQIRAEIFCNDQTIRLLKDRGVNSNWDILYVVYAVCRMLSVTSEYGKVLDYLKKTPYQALALYQFLEQNSDIGGRNDAPYEQAVAIFQEWYLGDTLYLEMYGKQPTISDKPGLVNQEQPLFPLEQTVEVLSTLQQAGYQLGIGTGRLAYEIEGPLCRWDIKRYFDANRLISYSDILQAERELPGHTLTKPHPYMFLKGMLGLSYPNCEIVCGTHCCKLIEKTLVIGDAGADLLAAQAAGMDFAAVLTGVSGKDARAYFEQNNATYILDSILDLIEEEA